MLKIFGSTGVYELFSLTNTLIGDPILSLPIPKKPNFNIHNSNITSTLGNKSTAPFNI